MNKSLLIAVLLAACGVAAAQEKNFSISVENLPLDIEEETVFKFFNKQAWAVIDSAKVSDWAISLSGHTDTTFIGWITNSHGIGLPVVVEPNMELAIDYDDFTVTGSAINKQLYRFMRREESPRSEDRHPINPSSEAKTASDKTEKPEPQRSGLFLPSTPS